jgi:hypothetical protein
MYLSCDNTHDIRGCGFAKKEGAKELGHTWLLEGSSRSNDNIVEEAKAHGAVAFRVVTWWPDDRHGAQHLPAHHCQRRLSWV